MSGFDYGGVNIGETDSLPIDQQTGPDWDFSDYNSDKPSNELTKDDFLILLTEELKNQDPLDPVQGSEFVAQLATFSQLEQAYNTNETLSKIEQYQESINSAQALSLIGKNVTAEGDLLTMENGEASPIRYITADTGTVTVKIYSADGTLVKTIDRGKEEAGYKSFIWTGENEWGDQMDDGVYTFEVIANNVYDYPMEVMQICEGPVTGVKFDENGAPMVMVGPQVDGLYQDDGSPLDPRSLIYLSDVLEVLPGDSSLSDSDFSDLLAGLTS